MDRAKNDIYAAGHFVGKDFSVQANLMLNDKVWPAMAQAFENTKGDLADRMLAALDAAQAVGGDIRGRAIGRADVVKAKSSGDHGPTGSLRPSQRPMMRPSR